MPEIIPSIIQEALKEQGSEKLLSDIGNALDRIFKAYYDPDKEDKYPSGEVGLKCVISVGKQKVPVIISSDRYPTKKWVKDTGYAFDIKGLDHITEINGYQGTSISREEKSEQPSDIMQLRFGHKYPTHPVWQRDMNFDELEKYFELVKVIESKENCKITRKMT